MTGYQSKKAAAQAIDEVNWADHEPNGRRAAARDKLKCQCSMSTKLVGSGCQYCNPEYMDDDDTQVYKRPWVGLTDAEAQWLYDNCRTPSNLIDMVETMLKDKNT